MGRVVVPATTAALLASPLFPPHGMPRWVGASLTLLPHVAPHCLPFASRCRVVVRSFQFGMDAVRDAGGVVEATLCYTGDVSDPSKTKVAGLAGWLVVGGLSLVACPPVPCLNKEEEGWARRTHSRQSNGADGMHTVDNSLGAGGRVGGT